MYRDGKGTDVNRIKAIEWFQKGILSLILQNLNILSMLFSPAKEAGDFDAKRSLRKMFEREEDIRMNPVKSAGKFISRFLRKHLSVKKKKKRGMVLQILSSISKILIYSMTLGSCGGNGPNDSANVIVG
jgi:hypothetical protein